MDELKKVSEAFNGIKNNLIDFKNLVAWINMIDTYINTI